MDKSYHTLPTVSTIPYFYHQFINDEVFVIRVAVASFVKVDDLIFIQCWYSFMNLLHTWPAIIERIMIAGHATKVIDGHVQFLVSVWTLYFNAITVSIVIGTETYGLQ